MPCNIITSRYLSIALKLRSLHPPRLCRLAVFSILHLFLRVLVELENSFEERLCHRRDHALVAPAEQELMHEVSHDQQLILYGSSFYTVWQ